MPSGGVGGWPDAVGCQGEIPFRARSYGMSPGTLLFAGASPFAGRSNTGGAWSSSTSDGSSKAHRHSTMTAGARALGKEGNRPDNLHSEVASGPSLVRLGPCRSPHRSLQGSPDDELRCSRSLLGSRISLHDPREASLITARRVFREEHSLTRCKACPESVADGMAPPLVFTPKREGQALVAPQSCSERDDLTR